MKKRLFAGFLAFCMMASAVPAEAANASQAPRQVDIADMVADDEEYETDIVVREDGSVINGDGRELSFSSYFDISLADRQLVKTAEGRSDYLEERGYAVEDSADGDGVVVTDQFQTCRLMVDDLSAVSLYGATEWACGDGMYFVSYRTEKAARNAYYRLQEDGYEVCPDVPYDGLDAGYVYTVDRLQQYSRSYTFSGTDISGQDILAKVDTSDDLMGLTDAGRGLDLAQEDTPLETVCVAVIDSGLDASNSLFAGRTMEGYSTDGGSTDDFCGHGTHVASIIVNNTPSNVRVLPVRVTDGSGRMTVADIIAGFQWCAQHTTDIDVINASISVDVSNPAFRDFVSAAMDRYIDALYDANVRIVTSAGNVSGTDSRSADESYPGCNSRTICVSNIDNHSTSATLTSTWSLAPSSKYGDSVDFCAPGCMVTGVQASNMSLTKWDMQAGRGGYISLPNGRCLMTGTSQASPMVAAALADLLSLDGTMTSDQQYQALRQHASREKLSGASSLWDAAYGYGYIDLHSLGVATSAGASEAEPANAVDASVDEDSDEGDTEDWELDTASGKVGRAVVTAAKKKSSSTIALKYRKLKGVDGYQIQYSHQRNFKNRKTINVDPSRLSCVIKLKTGGRTYIRVRGYRWGDGGKRYGAWSRISSVKL